MSDIAITAREHSLRAYLRVPEGQGPWPGVVVLHDVFGQTDDNRRYVDWFAASGYLAVAPDLFSWNRTVVCLIATFRNLNARTGPAWDDIDAARSFLAMRQDCTGRVGVIGFCMGGSFALLAATRGFATSSVNYGIVPPDAETVLQGACPIVGSFGARDRSLRGAASRLENALTANRIPHDVKEYSAAGHAFLNNHGGVSGWVMARIGIKFHEPSAKDAQARILEFFKRHLSPPAPPLSV